jgi:hypothetical protein
LISVADAGLLLNAGGPAASPTGALSDRPPAAAFPLSTRETEHVLAEWTGSAMMTTRPFHVEGPWELQWTNTSGYFSVHLVKIGGESELVARQSDAGNSSSYVPNGGDYYLKVSATSSWEIRAVSLEVTTQASGPGAPRSPIESQVAKQASGTLALKSSSGMPRDEEAVLRIVDAAMAQYRNGQNEMQRGAARPTRARSICSVLTERRAQDWIGTIKTLSTNGEGKGILYVEIAPNVEVRTTNNALSNVLNKTLIDPGSSLFRTVSQLRESQKIRFSGTFIESDTDCIEETSITLEGSITEPEFVIRFESVAAIE